MGEKKQESPTKFLQGFTRWMREPVTIVIATACGFISTYFFELGFTGYFDIPTTLISIDIYTIIFATLPILFLISPIIPLTPFFFERLSTGKIIKDFYFHLFVVVPLSVMIGSQLIAFSIEIQLYSKLKISTVNIIWLGIILILLIVNKLMGPPVKRKKIRIPKKFKQSILFLELFLVVFILLASLPYFLGSLVAKIKTKYLITNQPINTIILKKYGENFICSKLNRDDNSIFKKYFIIKESDFKEIEFHLEGITNLKVKNLPKQEKLHNGPSIKPKTNIKESKK